MIWPTQAQAMEFYGDPRKPDWYKNNVIEVPCPWKLTIGDITADHIHVHKKCAEALLKALNGAWVAVDRDPKQVKAQHMDIFDGCYNLRAMRGGKRLSMHSFACALDFDAEHNQFGAKKHFFTEDHPLVRNFEAQGAVWGGYWNSPDAMHFQFARVK